MKLAYCIHSLYNSGGTERVLTEKVNALSRDYGYDITVITACQRGRKPFFELDPSVKTIDVGVNFYRLFSLPGYMRRLERILSDLKPDVCVSLSNYEIYSLAGLRDGSVKIAEFHFTHDRWFLEKGRFSLKAHIRTRRLERSAAGLSRFVVLTDADAAGWGKKVPALVNAPGRDPSLNGGGILCRIYNPSPFPAESSPLDSRKMIAVGRLCRQKDFPTLIRSWALVHGKHPDWKLCIYGEGPDRKELEKLIRRLSLDEVISLNHNVPDIKSKMQESSALIMSSIYEGLGMTLVEGCSLGLPLISTDCKCGPSEIIADGENGFLVKVGDAEMMADRICRLIEDPGMREAFGRRSLALSGKFSEKNIIARWDALFKSLPERRECGRRDFPPSRVRIDFIRFRIFLGAHVFNPLWQSSDSRRGRRGKVIADAVTTYLVKRCLHAADAVKPGPVGTGGEEKIYSIWFQGEENAPALVRACFDSIRRNCREELLVLDADSIYDYITLPEEIVRKFREGKIKYCHFADICRVELLHRYGGFWIDATCFLTGDIPDFIRKEDFFMFMAGSKVHGNYSFVQNCFIRARKGSYLLEAWRSIILSYWMEEDKRLEYFQHQLMFKALVLNNETAARYFAGMPQIDQAPTHILWYRDASLPFDAEMVDEMTREGFFFQKCTYRDAEQAVPGSFKEWILNSGRLPDSRRG